MRRRGQLGGSRVVPHAELTDVRSAVSGGTVVTVLVKLLTA